MRALNGEVEELNREVEELNRDTATFLDRLRGQATHTEADRAELRRIGERRREIIERMERASMLAATADGTAGTA